MGQEALDAETRRENEMFYDDPLEVKRIRMDRPNRKQTADEYIEGWW